MKIRNYKKCTYIFHPHIDSKIYKGKIYKFKYKSDLMRFLNKNVEESINGTVSYYISSFGSSGENREWFVWYNDYDVKGAKLKISLRQLYFRGKKYIFKETKASKETKKYFAFSKKIIRLMCSLKGNNETILPQKAKKLTELFYKRGFKDFEPTDEDWKYINGHIGDGINFSHWSDRCNWLRTKTIIEYFKRNNLI